MAGSRDASMIRLLQTRLYLSKASWGGQRVLHGATWPQDLNPGDWPDLHAALASSRKQSDRKRHRRVGIGQEARGPRCSTSQAAAVQKPHQHKSSRVTKQQLNLALAALATSCSQLHIELLTFLSEATQCSAVSTSGLYTRRRRQRQGSKVKRGTCFFSG